MTAIKIDPRLAAKHYVVLREKDDGLLRFWRDSLPVALYMRAWLEAYGLLPASIPAPLDEDLPRPMISGDL